MKIEFIGTDYTLTTDHPTSSYGLGVLINAKDGVYMPSNPLPVSPNGINVFGDLPPMLAGEFVMHQATQKIYSLEEINLMRRYLSQDPQGRYALPDDTDLYAAQAKNHLSLIVGDTSQGVHEVYWHEAKAIVSRMIYEASQGQYYGTFNTHIVRDSVAIQATEA